MLRKGGMAGLFAVMPGAAFAQVTVTDLVFSPTHMGRGQETTVTVKWSHNGASPGAFEVPVPAAFSVVSPGANCSGTNPLSCITPAAGAGETGEATFTLRAEQIATANLTANGTGASSGSATATYYINASGAVSVLKEKTSPAGNPIAGQEIIFTLRPQVASGDDIPANAEIVVTDQLPGAGSEFEYISHAASGITPAPSCSYDAGQREVRCVYTDPVGGWTRAQLNAAAITVRGRALIAGDSLINQAVVDVDPTRGYVDLTLGDNVATVPLQVSVGGDLVAGGSFPSGAVNVNSSQTLNIRYTNNGPLDATGDGMVSTIIPAGFTIGVLPAQCTGAGAGTINGLSGTRIDCTATGVANGAHAEFALPLTMPATAGTGNFPILVTPPSGFADYNEPNNLTSVPYNVVNPFADLRLSKSKSPGGPRPAGTTITHSFTVTNDASSTFDATYSASQPLRVVDWLRPEEIATGPLSVTAGWSCNLTDATDPNDSNRTKQVTCQTTGDGTLAIGASITLSFQTTLASVGAPVALTNRACTGAQALTALGLDASNGPQPADPNTSNDCATASGSPQLYVTNLTTPTAAVKKYVSTDGSEPSLDSQVVSDAPSLANDGQPLKWRIVITTPAGNEDIATLRLTDTIPARISAQSGLWPATGTTIAVSGSGYSGHNCPATLGASDSLACNFTNVEADANIVVDVTMQRPIRQGNHENTVTLSSPDSVLAATSGGALSDPAWVTVTPRYDPSVTSKTISKPEPAIGETVGFTINIRNAGAENLPVGSFTVTDTINTNPAELEAAFEILSISGSGMDCAASNLATGALSCTNTTALNANNTRALNISARLKKPVAPNTLPASGGSYMWSGDNQTNTATVTLDSGLCEWRELTQVSTACDDAAALSNNSQSVNFRVKVPDFDMQVKIDKLHSAPVGIDDALVYRLRMRNAGPSLAENASITMYLDTPDGYALKPVVDGSDNIVVENINNVENKAGGAVTVGFTYKAGAGVSCLLVDATTTPEAPPAVRCTLTGAAGPHLDDKQEVSFELKFDLEVPPTGATGPVTIGVPPIVCADELAGHERAGACRSAERATNGFDPAYADNAADYGNNYERVNDIIFPITDLLLSKSTITASPVSVAQPVEFRLTMGNKGSDTPSRIRVVDTLPAGFEWLSGVVNGVDYTPVVAVAGAAQVSGIIGDQLSVSGAVPAPVGSLQNVCYVSNGVTEIAAPADQQEITCDLQGTFPPDTDGDVNTVTVTLYARAKAGVYAGPYGSDVANNAEVEAGMGDDGNPVSIDRVPGNNPDDSVIQLVRSSIAGRVYHDDNFSGAYTAGNPPISGVTLTLTGTSNWGDAVSRATTTAADGTYLFDDLPSGTYTVTQTHPSGWLDGPETAGSVGGSIAVNEIISNIALPADTAATDYNFGEYLATDVASISGHVYHDVNNNGVFDAGESPIGGVTIELTGPVSRSTATNGSGFYEFTDLPPGTYTVREIQPAAWADGKDTAGAPGTLVSQTNDRFVVELIPGQNGLNWNFGEQTPPPTVASLAGKVYHDRNDNGAIEAGEEGIAGVLITLWRDGSEVATATTDAQGAYGFTGLPAGTYRVTQAQPAGWVDGRETLGSGASGRGTTPANDEFSGVVLTGGDNAVEYNFGEFRMSSIAGVVFIDPNQNARLDGDEGMRIPGVTVTLTGVDSRGVTVERSVQTDASGAYRFDSLFPGNYTVTETSPTWLTETGAQPGVPVRGSASSNADTQQVSAIALASGENLVDYNFGHLGARVEGTVYHDKDKGGQWQPGQDEPLVGVTVRITDASGRVHEVTTDENGFFSQIVPPGATVVEVLESTLTGLDQPGLTVDTHNEGSNPTTVDVPLGGVGVDNTGYVGETAQAELRVVKTVYEGHNAGAGCPGVKELVVIDKSREPKPMTWCFALTNNGPTALANPQFDDAPLFTLKPGTAQGPLTLRAGSVLPLQPGETVWYYVEEMRDDSLINEVSVSMTPVDENGDPLDLPPVTGEDGAVTVFGYLYDPPFGVKTGEQIGGSNVVRWTMVWVNDNPVRAENATVSDQVPVGMTYQGGLNCVPAGTTTVSQCAFEPPSVAFPRGRVVVTADFGPDYEKTVDTAEHALRIAFDVTVDAPEEGGAYHNQGVVEWDPDGPGGEDPLEGVTDDPFNPDSSEENPAPTPVVIDPVTCVPGEGECPPVDPPGDGDDHECKEGNVQAGNCPPTDVTPIPVNSPLGLLLMVLMLIGMTMYQRHRTVMR
ncbi:MAG: SdrD B-like domain-containing protein [Rhodocyclaceae bacterium]